MNTHDSTGRRAAPLRYALVGLAGLGLAACAETAGRTPDVASARPAVEQRADASGAGSVAHYTDAVAQTSNAVAEPADEVNDPFEPVNRVTFQINRVIDTIVVRPVAETYRDHVPDPLQQVMRNFLRNLGTPVVIANNLFQGDFERAEINATRFFVNSTIGVGGLGDVMGMSHGYEYESADFGQTLGVWGVGEGPYLVLPVLGPSNVRDAIGRGVDSAMDPFGYLHGMGLASLGDANRFSGSRIGAILVDARAGSLDDLDEVERSSLDYYAAMRSLYHQYRNSMIIQGQPTPVAIPDYSSAPANSAPAGTAAASTGSQVGLHFGGGDRPAPVSNR